MVTDQALCLRVWEWSETSQTTLLLSRRLGLLRCLAKGSRRPKADFSGGLEPLTLGEIVVSTRALEKSGQALATLASWDLVEIFPALRRSLPAFYAGAAIADLIQHAIRDADPHPGILDAAIHALRTCADTPRAPAAELLRFTLALLRETGQAPELLADVRTGEALAPAPTYAFAPRLGGFTRDDAGAPALPLDVAREVGPLWRTRETTLGVLRAFSTESAPDPSPHPSPHPSPEDDAVARALRLMLRYAQESVGAQVRAADYWLSAATSAPPAVDPDAPSPATNRPTV